MVKNNIFKQYTTIEARDIEPGIYLAKEIGETDTEYHPVVIRNNFKKGNHRKVYLNFLYNVMGISGSEDFSPTFTLKNIPDFVIGKKFCSI